MAKQTVEQKKSRQAVQPEKPKETPLEFIQSIATLLVTGLFIITFCLQAKSDDE